MPYPIREEKDFGFDAEEVLSLITPATRLIIINSPANPTGGVVSRAEITKLAHGLAKHPNVAIKATGQAVCSTQDYPFRDIHPHLQAVYDAFGPRRMFWGTDITRQHCSWKQCISLFTEELPWLKGADLELVMGRAYCDWVGWA